MEVLALSCNWFVGFASGNSLGYCPEGTVIVCTDCLDFGQEQWLTVKDRLLGDHHLGEGEQLLAMFATGQDMHQLVARTYD